MKLKIVLTLTILLLTCASGSIAQPDTPDSLVTVPRSLIREATARIDALELELRYAEHRAVEQDSLHAAQLDYQRAFTDEANQRADAWRDEALHANSWWGRNESAVWLGLGAALAAWLTH